MDNQRIQSKEGSSSSDIDVKRIIDSTIKYWYLIVLSILVALSIAFLINRYTTRVYTVDMSILIREDKENIGAADILYSNPLVQSYRNFYNEIYLLKSYPLIESTIKDLDLSAKIVGEGSIKSSEVYNENINIDILNIDSLEVGFRQYQLKILSDSTFLLSNELTSNKYKFNKPFKLDGLKVKFNLSQNINLENLENSDYIFIIQSPAILAGSYLNRLKIDWAEEGASVINLSLSGSTPKKEVDFLNTLVKNYAKRDLMKKNIAATRSLEFIEEQLNKISDSLSVYENKLISFQNKNLLTDLSDEGNRLFEKLASLEEKLSSIRIQQNYFEYLIDYLENIEETDNLIVLPSSVGIQDPVLSSLLDKFMNIQMQLNSYTLEGSANNPLYNKLKAELDNLKVDILQSIRNAARANEIQENALDQQLVLLEQQISVLPALERRLINIRRTYNLNENMFIFLSQKHAETGITRASTTSDVDVINPARAAGPISPNPTRNYLIAFALGLILPVGLFIIKEITNNRILSKEDVDSLTNISFLGGVGHSSKYGNLVVLEKPKGVVAESFRALRSNLNYFSKGQEHKIFMITSSISGEGKTFASLNLATILAFSNKKSILIGADMRRPRIFDDLGLQNNIGLSSYLSNNKLIEEDVIQKTKIDFLDLISAGPVPPNPNELLITERMTELINNLKLKYDYIIIDTPPINIVADAMEIIKYVDHTIFLVRQGYTPKKAIENIEYLFHTKQIQNISIVLNDIKSTGY
ncbi:MAG: GumC family protein, partial [Candidatus Cyclobacteriaceae bacterium M2_1C_046]